MQLCFNWLITLSVPSLDSVREGGKVQVRKDVKRGNAVGSMRCARLLLPHGSLSLPQEEFGKGSRRRIC